MTRNIALVCVVAGWGMLTAPCEARAQAGTQDCRFDSVFFHDGSDVMKHKPIAPSQRCVLPSCIEEQARLFGVNTTGLLTFPVGSPGPTHIGQEVYFKHPTFTRFRVIDENPWIESIKDFIVYRTEFFACSLECSIDFNRDDSFPDDNDLIDFLNVLSGGTCSNDPFCMSIDFNQNCLFPEDNDLVYYLALLAGESCG